jgi:hypothetical protein
VQTIKPTATFLSGGLSSAAPFGLQINLTDLFMDYALGKWLAFV